MKEQTLHADKVQLAYAAVLSKATAVGIALVIVGYIAYLFNFLPLSVSVEQVAAHWHLRASELHQSIEVPVGWSFFHDPLKGDALSYMSIIYLGMVTMFCLVAAAIAFFREKNMIYTAISVLQVLVLIFAAAGIVSGEH